MPPCGGHPPEMSNALRKWDVSSRAPVWGASVEGAYEQLDDLVSSRAPVWGASSLLYLAGFSVRVSSRAPVWGASVHGGLMAL